MKAHWIYRCDHGHTWTFLREEDATEHLGDDLCPFGHEAVTLSKQRLLDAVQVGLRSAGRVVDPVKNQVGHEHEFHLVVTDLHRDVERVSARAHGWAQALAHLERFRGQPAARAWSILAGLDAESPDNGDRVRTLDAIETIRARPAMYLPSGRTDPATLALAVAGDVLVAPGRQVVCQRLADWWIVASGTDWLGPLAAEVFRRIVPFPEAGVNSLHAEILLMAFADDIVIFDRVSHLLVKGEVLPGEPIFAHRAAHPEWNRIIALRIRSATPSENAP